MKNYRKYLFLFIIIITMCGCSNKLVCTKETKTEEDKLVIKFKDNTPLTLNWTKTMMFASDDAYIDMSYLELQEYYSRLDGYSGITYKIKEKDKQDRIIIKINVDYNNYKELDTFSIPITKDNKDTNKANLENLGYICK